MLAPNTTVTRKIGLNRGQLRLWIEGKVLTDAGFTKGQRYDMEPIPNGYQLVLRPEGKRKVAGTDSRPIIDINSTAKLERFGESVRIRDLGNGTIDILSYKDPEHINFLNACGIN